MLAYCLKFRKKTESKNPNVVKKTPEEQWCYQILLFAVVKNRDLSKRKKLVVYLVTCCEQKYRF